MAEASIPQGGRVTVECAWCGKQREITPSKYRDNKGKRFYCDRKCLAHAEKAANRIEVACDYCGRSKRVTPHDYARRRRFFCGHECRGKATTAERRIAVECAQCGGQRTIPRSHHKLVSSGRFFCGKECMDRALSGENSPNWLGGYRAYYGPNWYGQRRRARERDNYVCQHCGASEEENGRELDVHHRTPFRAFGYVPEENKAYREANHLDNLISLCRPCHLRADARLRATERGPSR